MGYNLSGLLIKGISTHAIQNLAHAAGLQLTGEQRVIFEATTYNKYNSTDIDVYQTAQGILVLCDDPFLTADAMKRLSVVHKDILVFRMSETSMTFVFEHYQNGARNWEAGVIMETELQYIGDNRLGITPDTDVVFDTFGKLSTAYLGINFHQIDLEEKAVRFTTARDTTAGSNSEPGMITVDQKTINQLFERFIKDILYKREKGLLRSEAGTVLFSFESYLRESGEAEEKIQAYCKSLNEYDFNRVFKGMRKQGRTSAFRGLFKIGVIAIACITLLYVVVAALLSLFKVSIWSASRYGYFLLGIVALLFLAWLRMYNKGCEKRKEGKLQVVFQIYDGQDVKNEQLRRKV